MTHSTIFGVHAMTKDLKAYVDDKDVKADYGEPTLTYKEHRDGDVVWHIIPLLSITREQIQQIQRDEDLVLEYAEGLRFVAFGNAWEIDGFVGLLHIGSSEEHSHLVTINDLRKAGWGENLTLPTSRVKPDSFAADRAGFDLEFGRQLDS